VSIVIPLTAIEEADDNLEKVLTVVGIGDDVVIRKIDTLAAT
jgi:predicted SPOUT superfamily RNA methylase MTH1